MEENQENKQVEKPRRLRQKWKRILLFFLFFSILVGSLFYYVLLPKILAGSPLRRDPIPSGAYVIPWMRPNPSIEELNSNPQLPNSTPPFEIDDIMSDALKLVMTFRIDIPNGTRVVPSTVYLGHDSNYLYVGGKFTGMYTNPASTNDRIVPNFFQILFDVAGDGVLKKPESGSSLDAFVTDTGPRARSYHDMTWAYAHMYLGESRWAWIMADNYYYSLNKTQPSVALRSAEMEYDIPTGTVTMLFSRFLWLSENSEVNALQMRADERWVMGFLLELGYNTNSEAGQFVDGWQQKTYPYLSNDASWWPKLVIDLTNPPSEFAS